MYELVTYDQNNQRPIFFLSETARTQLFWKVGHGGAVWGSERGSVQSSADRIVISGLVTSRLQNAGFDYTFHGTSPYSVRTQ